MPDNPIGEVIEASATGFVAQCLEVPRQMVSRLYDPPPFGSFVKIGKPQDTFAASGTEDLPIIVSADEPDPFATPSLISFAPSELAAANAVLPAATFALVCGASTTSLEAGRRPSALGFADEDELRAQQPQIFELLRTEFTGMLVGYSDGRNLRRHLPPKPPRVHSRVYECNPAEARILTADLSFLRGLLSAPGGDVPPDELVAALLRQARDAHAGSGNDRDFLLRAGKTLAALLADDYDRLQAILRSVL